MDIVKALHDALIALTCSPCSLYKFLYRATTLYFTKTKKFCLDSLEDCDLLLLADVGRHDRQVNNESAVGAESRDLFL